MPWRGATTPYRKGTPVRREDLNEWQICGAGVYDTAEESPECVSVVTARRAGYIGASKRRACSSISLTDLVAHTHTVIRRIGQHRKSLCRTILTIFQILIPRTYARRAGTIISRQLEMRFSYCLPSIHKRFFM